MPSVDEFDEQSNVVLCYCLLGDTQLSEHLGHFCHLNCLIVELVLSSEVADVGRLGNSVAAIISPKQILDHFLISVKDEPHSFLVPHFFLFEIEHHNSLALAHSRHLVPILDPLPLDLLPPTRQHKRLILFSFLFFFTLMLSDLQVQLLIIDQLCISLLPLRSLLLSESCLAHGLFLALFVLLLLFHGLLLLSFLLLSFLFDGVDLIDGFTFD